jgi:hypothetical protein
MEQLQSNYLGYRKELAYYSCKAHPQNLIRHRRKCLHKLRDEKKHHHKKLLFGVDM